MPTREPQHALRPEHVREVVASVCFPASRRVPGVGLEVEVFPVVTRTPTRRLRLGSLTDDRAAAPGHELTTLGILSSVADLGIGHLAASPDGTVAVALDAGGTVTFEPGGQIEVSTACHDGVEAALDQAAATLGWLAATFAPHGVGLVSAGIDLWHDVDEVPQQLRAPRYPAMAAYLARRGPAGRTMMRHTCALQVNLDMGDRADRDARWAVANLVAPVATATFACSPTRAARSARAATWAAVDPTRTGIPAGFVEGSSDPVEQMADAALAADVLLVRTDRGTTPGRPDWRFGDWLRRGDPEHGWPTTEDLRYHLTTLFHEVRPRGSIEVRSIDALPARWRGVPAVLLTGLLYDPVARDRVRDVLEPHRADLPGLLDRAATTGLADGAMCALAVETWSYALDGARRLGVASTAIREVERFIDTYTVRGLAPADDLTALFAVDPDAALAWASEPVPAAAGVGPGGPRSDP